MVAESNKAATAAEVHAAAAACVYRAAELAELTAAELAASGEAAEAEAGGAATATALPTRASMRWKDKARRKAGQEADAQEATLGAQTPAELEDADFHLRGRPGAGEGGHRWCR